MFDVALEAITYSNAIAIIFAATSFILTIAGIFLAVLGVRSASLANRDAKLIELQREKRREGFELLRIVAGGPEAYVDGKEGRFMSTQMMVLSAAMLSDHPELIGSIKALRKYMDRRSANWEPVKAQLEITIREIDARPRSKTDLIVSLSQ